MTTADYLLCTRRPDLKRLLPCSALRVLVADDQALVRGAFSALIDSAPDLHVVGEAGTGTQAVELTRREHPDVVLMDIRTCPNWTASRPPDTSRPPRTPPTSGC